MSEKWKKVRSDLLRWLTFWLALTGGLAFWQWGAREAMAVLLSALCLALGLWVTELLVSIFMGVRKANATAILLLFTGKILWWGSLFFASRYLPPGLEKPIALGIGAFLLAMVCTGFAHYGMPKISDIGNQG